MTAAAAAQEYTHRRQTSLEQEVAFLREDNTRLRKQLAAESAHEFAHQLKQSQQEVQALHDEVARYRATMDAVVQQATRARTEARSDRERVVALTEELREAHGHARFLALRIA